MCRRYRQREEKIGVFASATGKGGLPAVTGQSSTSVLGGEKGTIIRTPRATSDFLRSNDNPEMKADPTPRETAREKWDLAMEVDWSGYFKAARPTAPAIKDRNYDKNIHVTSTNDVRSNFGRSNDFTSKVENIGCIEALPMDRRVPHARAHVATQGCHVAGAPATGWKHRTGSGVGLVVSIGQ